MNDEERDEFARSLRRAVEGRSGAVLDAELAAAGWHDAFGEHPADAVAILFDAMGTQDATSSALEFVLGVTLGLDVGPGRGVLLPAPAATSPPGHRQGGTIAVRGLGTSSPEDRLHTWVVVNADEAIIALDVPVAELTFRRVGGIDPRLGLVEATGSLDGGHPSVDVSDKWTAALATSQRALGHQLVGASRAMLELARQHALERVQFGQPISHFQAVRHRLAEALVAIESAEAVLQAAAEDGSPTTAAVAKALAGRTARTASRHCQQVLAGIGFTTEHAFHRFARRAMALDLLCGSSRQLTKEFGAGLLTAGGLPDFAPL